METKYKIVVWFYQSTKPQIIDNLCRTEAALIKNKLDKSKIVAKADITAN